MSDASSNGATPQDPNQVFPGLVPAQWRVEQTTLVDSAGENPILCTILELRTPTGMHITFWPEDTALVLAQHLLDVAQATAEGRVLAAER